MMPMAEHTLILGGAKSGKSTLALTLAERTGLKRVFIATAEARDAEMSRRIARHQAERGPSWRTVEEPLELVAALGRADAPDTVVLVDCLTLWLSNLLTRAANLRRGRGGRALPGSPAPRCCPGCKGPGDPGGQRGGPGHRARQRLGQAAGATWPANLNQSLAAACDRVIFW